MERCLTAGRAAHSEVRASGGVDCLTIIASRLGGSGTERGRFVCIVCLASPILLHCSPSQRLCLCAASTRNSLHDAASPTRATATLGLAVQARVGNTAAPPPSSVVALERQLEWHRLPRNDGACTVLRNPTTAHMTSRQHRQRFLQLMRPRRRHPTLRRRPRQARRIRHPHRHHSVTSQAGR